MRLQDAWPRCYGLGDPDGFVFNMSVGYDLEGIKGEKVDTYLERHDGRLRDRHLRGVHGPGPGRAVPGSRSGRAYIDAISPRCPDSVTVSTLHGCPPDEIERIATYLITEKELHTFVKCNPTLLGYESARNTLDDHGLRLHRL